MTTPHTARYTKRLTMLDCEVGNHSAHFPITRTALGWACPKHGG